MPDQKTPEQVQPTADEQAALQEVGAAGAEAAAEGKDVTEAMGKARDKVRERDPDNKVGQMSDEDLGKISEQLFGRLADLFEERGAFQAGPEPVQPPSQPTAPEAPAATSAEQVPPPAAPAPQKRNAAQRFFGVD